MQRNIPPEAERYTKQNNRRRIWRKFVQMMACIVVFCTTYALILPAITMEKTIVCEIEEHKHAESCYTIVDSEQIQKLACTYTSLGVHVHTEECRGEDGQLLCGYADYLVHQHNAACSSDGVLICQIPEVEEHEHTESCYQEVTVESETQEHNHDASCYTNKRGELICQIVETEGHAHLDACYTLSDTLVCGLEEKTGHTHTETCAQTVQVCELVTEPHEHDASVCYQQLTCELPEDETHTHSETCTGSVLNCTLTEQPHNHTESCYQTNYVCGLVEEAGHAHSDACRESVLSCGLEEAEGHQHADSCYTQEQVLTCQSEETKTELELVCEKQVIKLHSHEDACYETYLDETGAQQQRLICEETVVLEHNHETSCYIVEEVPLDNAQTLTCLQVEAHTHAEDCYDEAQQLICTEVENHTHGTLCYGTWELTCEQEEHIHTELCRALSEEEQIQVDAVIAQINALPTAEEADAHLLQLEEAQDMENYEAYFTEVGQNGRKAYEAYEALNEVQKTRVTNLDKLMELSYIWSIVALPDNSFQLGEIPDCSCTNGESVISAHADDCEKKKFFRTLAEDCTAEELYSVWQEIPEDARDYILAYLSWNYQYYDKLNALKDLIANGSGGIKEELDGTTFEITGTLPDNADLVVADAEYEEEKTFSFLNPNMWADVNQYWVYDIEIQVDQQTYQPEEAVTVTVTSPEFVVTEDEYFCVAHLDAENNEIISSTYVDVVDNSITFEATGFSPYLFYTVDKDIDGGERIWGTNWMKVDDSYFTYWNRYVEETPLEASSTSASFGTQRNTPASSVQIHEDGGTNTSDDGVSVSKLIEGTELENVFDITLTVSTTTEVGEIVREPDMAVVLVMDASNTMREDLGSITKFQAAIDAADIFVDQFKSSNEGASKIGCVVFNTNADRVCQMQQCYTDGQAVSFKNKMRTHIGTIMDKFNKTASTYDDDYYTNNRYTNIEAGLRTAKDMLSEVDNEHKYIIFLSDGMPTTYVEAADGNGGYTGYEPYSKSDETPNQDGVFYDLISTNVTGYKKFIGYGTNYSDKGAIRAQNTAKELKDGGVTIFSVGAGVETFNAVHKDENDADFYVPLNSTAYLNDQLDRAQRIGAYEGKTNGGTSTVDNYVTSRSVLAVGDITQSDEVFKPWLKDKIGSGYYYNATSKDELNAAYAEIFEELTILNTIASTSLWTVNDPIPLANGSPESVEFIGLWDTDGNLHSDYYTDADTSTEMISLSGTNTLTGENTAKFNKDSQVINWDLKQSGYTSNTVNNVTTFTYVLPYRVRLQNENTDPAFIEDQIYATNGETTLKYQTITQVGENVILSDVKYLNFPIPSVKGWLGELSFNKVDSLGNPLAGAEFTLAHDTSVCAVCRGDEKTPVSIRNFVATSDENGVVSFSKIPSGHMYALTETKIPAGYTSNGYRYQVQVSYDIVTVSVYDQNGNLLENGWNGKIVNNHHYELPNTGGAGTHMYTLAGLVLMLFSAAYLLYKSKARRREVS